MRVEDAPRPGWYPDPEGGVRLRWWDGVDWADRWRSRPASQSSMEAAPAPPNSSQNDSERDPNNIGIETPWGSANVSAPGGQQAMANLPSAAQAREMFERARRETLEQAQRATQQSIDQVRRAATSMEPLIGQYASTASAFLRRIVFVVVALMILWFVLQAFATAGMWNWIGERIDNLGTPSGSFINSVVDTVVNPVLGAVAWR